MGNQGTLDKWIKEVEKSREFLSKLKKGDRLEICASLVKLHGAIVGSLQGWAVWLKSPAVLDQLTEEELIETFEIYQKLAVEFLDLDLKMSKAVLEKQPKKEKKAQTYVS